MSRLKWRPPSWLAGLLAEHRIRPGDIYEDCSYHPVLCTENDRGDLAGISLIDGSGPRCCSMFHCGTVKMTPAEVQERLQKWNDPAFQEAIRIPWETS